MWRRTNSSTQLFMRNTFIFSSNILRLHSSRNTTSKPSKISIYSSEIISRCSINKTQMLSQHSWTLSISMPLKTQLSILKLQVAMQINIRELHLSATNLNSTQMSSSSTSRRTSTTQNSGGRECFILTISREMATLLPVGKDQDKTD